MTGPSSLPAPSVTTPAPTSAGTTGNVPAATTPTPTSTPTPTPTPTNQPGVLAVIINQTTAAGCTTTVTLNNTYKVSVKFETYNQSNQGMDNTNANLGKLRYVMVYASPNAPESWTIIKLESIGNSVLFPLSKAGDYRLYVREPALPAALAVPLKVGDPFNIPFHMKADGTASTHQVQAFFALKVTSPHCTSNINPEQLTPPFTVITYLPNTLGRGANFYPVTGQNYTVTAAQITNTLLLRGFTNAQSGGSDDVFRITFQLWSDISRTYGHTHPIVQTSPYRAALEKIYKEEGSAPNHECIFTFPLAGRSRTIHFEAGGTAGARGTKSYATQNAMTASEAIRRIHPTVWDYWLSVMQTCDITYVKITSGWRPHVGSVLHRYSIGLDFNHTRGIIMVPNPNYHSVTNPQTHLENEVRISFRNDGGEGNLGDCNPTTALSAGGFTERDKRIKLATKILNRIAKDRYDSRLGWTGGPWDLRYSDVGVASTQVFIEEDITHRHHIHLTIGEGLS